MQMLYFIVPLLKNTRSNPSLLGLSRKCTFDGKIADYNGNFTRLCGPRLSHQRKSDQEN